MTEMTKQFEELKAILEPYIQNKEGFDKIDSTTHFINDLEINSANLVDVVLDVEDKYDIEIDNDSMEQMTTVEAALEVINTKLKDLSN